MPDRPAILLVHGAWHGSWAWESVASRLSEHGWDVRTIDLPTVHSESIAGLHLSADSDAVRDAIAAIDGPVVVVAHSYGGVPVTQAALASNVQHIVYVAAFALDVGESLVSAVGGEPPSWWVIDGPVATAGTDDEPAASLFFGDVDDRLAAESVARLKPQSVLAFQEPLTEAVWRTVPSTYLVTGSDAIFPAAAQTGLAERAGATVRHVDSSHSPFLSRPDEVVAVIEEAAGGR
jgi:pimeloyl-ACP methyl ester carboxylesterase